MPNIDTSHELRKTDATNIKRLFAGCRHAKSARFVGIVQIHNKKALTLPQNRSKARFTSLPQQPIFSWNSLQSFAAFIAVFLICPSTSQALIRTWDGGGNNDNWTTINNWNGNATLPATTDDVIFAGSFSSGTSIDTIADRTINSLTINTLTGFTLGNAADDLTLTSGILNRNDLVGTEANHTITSPIILGANGLWAINGSGTLTINGAIQDGASSFSLEKSGGGTLVLSGGAETYNGDTTISGGILRLGADNQIADGAGFGNLIINSGAAFDLASYLETINGLSGDGIVDKTTGGNDETLTVGSNNANGNFSGVIQNTDTNDLLNLTKTGTGTQTLSGNNTYRGTTTLSAGTLRATSNANALGSGTLSLGGGTLELANDTGLAFNRNTTVTASTTIKSDVLTPGGTGVTHTLGTLSIGLQTLTIGMGSNVGSGTGEIAFGAVTLTGSSTFSASLGTLLTLGAIDSGGGADRTITFGGAGNLSVTGIIDDATGPGNTTFVTKTGIGTLTLSGANTYLDTTTVSAGTLIANNTTGSATGTGAVSVASSAALGGTGIIAPGGSNGINVTGILKPGGSNNTGNLTFNLGSTTGTVVMNNAASLEFELGLPGVAMNSIGISDLISLAGATTGDFAFNGNIIDFLGTGASGYYKLFDTSNNNSNTWTGLVFNGSTGLVSSGLNYSNLSGGLTGNFLVGTAANGGTTGDIYFHIIPEPSVALLGGISLLFLLRRRR